MRNPFYFGTEEVNAALGRRLSVRPFDNLIGAALGADVIFVRPRFTPEFSGEPGGFRTAEIHARIHREDGYEAIEVPKGPLADLEDPDQIHDIDCWPKSESFIYAIEGDDSTLASTHFVVARGNNSMFLSAAGLRGMEQFMMDMALKPEMCHAILRKITDYNLHRIKKFLDKCGDLIDVVDIGDDVAGQSGMLFSVDMWKEYFKPYVAELVGEIKEHGNRVLFFGCGGFRDIIPDFIEMGVDCAGRMQTEAVGNSLSGLKSDFGCSLCIWGALDAQHALIEGGKADAATHTREVMSIGGAGGRFVAGPTHTFTKDTPVENILAVYSTLREGNMV